MDKRKSIPNISNLVGDSVHRTIQSYFIHNFSNDNLQNTDNQENKNFKQKELEYIIENDKFSLKNNYEHFKNQILIEWREEWGEMLKFYLNYDFLRNKIEPAINILLETFENKIVGKFKNRIFGGVESNIEVNLADFFEFHYNLLNTDNQDFKKYSFINFTGYIDLLFYYNNFNSNNLIFKDLYTLEIYDIKVPYKLWTEEDFKSISKISQAVLYFLVSKYLISNKLWNDSNKIIENIKFNYLFFNIKENNIKIKNIDIDKDIKLQKKVINEFKKFIDEVFDFEKFTYKNNIEIYTTNTNACKYCPYSGDDICNLS